MFKKSNEELKKLGADITVNEVKQQPELWEEAFSIYSENKEKIEKFLNDIKAKHGKKVRVIFTGAGTSEYVGNTVQAYLGGLNQNDFIFESIATTNIVSNPYNYLRKDEPTILVSFARSGNSPESVKSVELLEQVVKDSYNIFITCAKEGKLAVNAKEKDLLLLMPEKSNDKGFAMTGSFSCMALSAILIFDIETSFETKAKYVKLISKMGKEVIANEDKLQKIVDLDFDRIVYIGSGVFSALTKEAQLKILELTAGQIATCYDSSMGFRHGPKSFINEKTLIVQFISTNEYTRTYDLDVAREIHEDKIAKEIYLITKNNLNENIDQFSFNENEEIKDIYLTLPYIMAAQTISVMSSLKVQNRPDTPSKTGTVNRVVKGVILHDYKGE